MISLPGRVRPAAIPRRPRAGGDSHQPIDLAAVRRLPPGWWVAILTSVLVTAAATAVFPPAAALFLILPFGVIVLVVLLYRPGYRDAMFWPVTMLLPFEYDLGAGLRMVHFAVLLALLVTLAYFAVVRRLAIRRTPLDAPVFLLCVWAWAGVLWTPDFVGGVQIAARITFGGLLYFLPRVFMTTPSAIRRGLVAWLVTAFIDAMLSFNENLSTEVGQGDAGRQGGSVHPNVLGVYLSASLFLGVGLYVASKGSLKRLAILGSIGMSFGVLLLTQSRAAWGGLVIGGGILLVLWKELRNLVLRKSVIIGICATAIVAVVAIRSGPEIQARLESFGSAAQGEDVSMSVRGRLWAAALDLFMNSGGLGCGVGGVAQRVGTIGRYYDHPHSIPIYVVSELGMIGLGLFIWMLATAAECVMRRLAVCRDASVRSMLLGTSGAMIATAVQSLVDFDLRFKMHWLLLGYAAALTLAPDEETAPDEVPATVGRRSVVPYARGVPTRIA